MTPNKATVLGLCTAVITAVAVTLWIGHEYQRERDARKAPYLVRGQAVLWALEGGMRSHRRIGNWMVQQAGTILEETAKAPGIKGLAIHDATGQLIAKGGAAPESIRPATEPQWTMQGLVLSRQTPLSLPDSPDSPEPRGRGPYGTGAGSDKYQSPYWLTVLLDVTPYTDSLNGDRRRYGALLLIAYLTIALTWALWSQVRRRLALSGELALAREREKHLEELAHLGAGLAHETKNPLSIIRGLAQCWQGRAPKDAEQQTCTRRIIDEADRIVGRLNAFLQFARVPAPQPEAIDLPALLQDILSLFQDEARDKKMELALDGPAAAGMADAGMLRQVLVNLLTNALSACGEGDRIGVCIRQDGKHSLALEVADTGKGIAAEDLPHVTEPYFSRREGGAGLGLAIVDQIVQAHGWKMAIESTPDQGCSVTIAGIQKAETE